MPTATAGRETIGGYRDVRGDHRWLRITWHPAHSVFVLSMWRGDVCAATFQMNRDMSADLVSDLVRSLSSPVEITWSERSVITRRRRLQEQALALSQRFKLRRR